MGVDVSVANGVGDSVSDGVGTTTFRAGVVAIGDGVNVEVTVGSSIVAVIIGIDAVAVALGISMTLVDIGTGATAIVAVGTADGSRTISVGRSVGII